MNRTIKDIQKDIELLGINGGYDVEELLTPQDCRRLSYEIERLNNIIKEVREYIKQTGQYLEDIKRFKVDVLEPDYLNLLEILDKE